MLVQQAEGRSKTEAIDELHDGDQFFQPVLQRRAGQHDGVGRGDLLDAAGGARVPVLDALGLVEDDQVGRPRVDQVEIAMNGVVIGDLEEGVGGEVDLAAGAQAADDLDGAVAEALDLALPLVLERGRADDQDALDAEEPGHDLGGGDGLDGLAQAHLVADQAAAGPRGEQDALALVIVQRHFEQVLEGGAAAAARERLGDALPAALGVAHLGDEGEHVVVAAQLVIVAVGLGEERLEAAERLRQQRAVGVEVVAPPAGPARRGSRCRAGNAPRGARRSADRPRCRAAESRPQSRRAAALAFQAGERELDVLAGAQRVGGEIRTGAVVVARLHAADVDAIGALRSADW